MSPVLKNTLSDAGIERKVLYRPSSWQPCDTVAKKSKDVFLIFGD